jgi:hypothetical protein
VRSACVVDDAESVDLHVQGVAVGDHAAEYVRLIEYTSPLEKAGSSPATDVRRIPHRRRRWPKRRACGMGLILQLLGLSNHFRDVADGVFSTSVTRISSRVTSRVLKPWAITPAVRAP